MRGVVIFSQLTVTHQLRNPRLRGVESIITFMAHARPQRLVSRIHASVAPRHSVRAIACFVQSLDTLSIYANRFDAQTL